MEGLSPLTRLSLTKEVPEEMAVAIVGTAVGILAAVVAAVVEIASSVENRDISLASVPAKEAEEESTVVEKIGTVAAEVVVTGLSETETGLVGVAAGTEVVVEIVTAIVIVNVQGRTIVGAREEIVITENGMKYVNHTR